MENTDRITQQLLPLIEKIKHHSLYDRIGSITHLRIFMEHHVFAVYDFMCLLKELHRRIVCTQAPWFPPQDAYCAHLIAQILVEEEGDLAEDQIHYLCHFDLYLAAMKKIGANTQPIQDFLHLLTSGSGLTESAIIVGLPKSVQQFINTTFSFFDSETHALASAFVYGREAITPSLFTPLVQRLGQSFNTKEKNSVSTLLYYLNRHIELDHADHFPKALQMLKNLAGEDERKWTDILLVASRALQARLKFLTSIENAMSI